VALVERDKKGKPGRGRTFQKLRAAKEKE